MLKLALVPIGALVPAAFFAALSLYAPLPAALCVVLCVLLFLPTTLLPICDLLGKSKVRRCLQRAAEAIIEAYLYLLIVLLADAAILLLFHLLGQQIFPPLLFAVSGGVYLCALTVGILHARVIKVRKHSLTIDTEGREGSLRAVVFSDLHLGYFTTKGLIDRLQKTVEAQKPDVILFAGDLFDSDFEELRRSEHAREMLVDLDPPLGFFACEGNHDAYSEDDLYKDAFVYSTGITFLRDEKVALPLFELAGRLDKKKKGRLPAASYQKKNGLPLIVLDHQPSDAEALIDAGADLVICGHTHNGQTFPGNILAHILGRYNYGLRAYKGGCCLTTSGAGYWGLPMRLFTSNEIVVLDLKIKSGRKDP